MTYLAGISELFTDKYKLIHQVRRPIPKSEFNLKIWGAVLSIISYLSIFVNAGLLCFGSKSVDVFANKVLGLNPYYKLDSDNSAGTGLFSLLTSSVRGKDTSQ